MKRVFAHRHALSQEFHSARTLKTWQLFMTPDFSTSNSSRQDLHSSSARTSQAFAQISANNASSRKQLLGILFVVLGASSYGMLSTFVKLAYKQGYTTAEVTLAQFFWGALALTIMAFYFDRKSEQTLTRITSRDAVALAIAGLTVGFTSVLYYAAVQYIDASVAVVLLMQSVWMGVVIEAIQTKAKPSFGKIAAVVLILFGTLLATNAFGARAHALDPRGIILGLLAALSFSLTLFSTNSVAAHLPPLKRSQFMLYGGSFVVVVFALLTQVGPLNFTILYKHGLFVAVFGTIIPPLMLNRGFPIVGVGLGSILSSIELPFAMTVAFLLLGEHVGALQWAGVATILSAVVLLNYKLVFSKNS